MADLIQPSRQADDDTALDPVVEPPAVPVLRRSPRRIGLWLAVGWLALTFGVALFADLLPIMSYDRLTLLPTRTAIGWRLPEFLGTDSLGRSMLSRLIYGARQSLEVGILATSAATIMGTVIGVSSGYLRGKVDAVSTIGLDVLLAFPPLMLLLAITSVASRDVKTVIVGLAVLGTPGFARLTRTKTMAIANREFVMAARAMGASRRRIIFGELFPNVLPAIGALVFLYMGVAIVAEGSLSFLGVGVPPPKPSWGGMINDGRQFLELSPHLVFLPAIALMLTVLSFRVVGDALSVRFGAKVTGR